MKMTNFLTLGLTIILATACGASQPAATAKDAQPVSGKITITGADATNLVLALQSTGVPGQYSGGGTSGVLTLNARSIDCQAPVVPNALASCSVVTDAGTLTAPVSAATNIFQILLNHGGKVFSGVIGTDAVASDVVSCTHVLVPHAPYTCTMYVGIRNS